MEKIKVRGVNESTGWLCKKDLTFQTILCWNEFQDIFINLFCFFEKLIDLTHLAFTRN